MRDALRAQLDRRQQLPPDRMALYRDALTLLERRDAEREIPAGRSVVLDTGSKLAILGRVDFVHRTFQEYLAAKEATEDQPVDTLVTRAHLGTPARAGLHQLARVAVSFPRYSHAVWYKVAHDVTSTAR